MFISLLPLKLRIYCIARKALSETKIPFIVMKTLARCCFGLFLLQVLLLKFITTILLFSTSAFDEIRDSLQRWLIVFSELRSFFLFFRFIYDQFICTDRNTKDNVTGIQLLGVILTNGFHPYMHGVSVAEET